MGLPAEPSPLHIPSRIRRYILFWLSLVWLETTSLRGATSLIRLIRSVEVDMTRFTCTATAQLLRSSAPADIRPHR